jgi:hypothetical protein
MFAPLSRPAYFKLMVTGRRPGGATVTIFLASSSKIGLVVAPVVGVKTVCSPAGCSHGGVPVAQMFRI